MAEYEFGGPLDVIAIILSLPLQLYRFAFSCNDSSGRQIQTLLRRGNAMLVTVAYYIFELRLSRILPGQEIHGTKLVRHDLSVLYRFNLCLTLTICAAGTFLQETESSVWTDITNKDVRLLTAIVLIFYTLSAVVYIESFTVDTKCPNGDLRRCTLPLSGQIDIKSWCEACPRQTGWDLLNLCCVTQQYRSYGYVSDSLNESSILTVMNIHDERNGLYAPLWRPSLGTVSLLNSGSLSRRLPCSSRLAAHPSRHFGLHLGIYTFNAANNQKQIRSLFYLQTQRGSGLLGAPWRGLSRHINYFGDWLSALPFSLWTGLPGNTILPAGAAFRTGMIFTYFYVVYVAVLPIHRERPDDTMCGEKYGRAGRPRRSCTDPSSLGCG
ncbi:ergosterol biosynthesis ERG4/ERG24 family-domain-containing protein [Aspergillus recurvatus]